MCQVSGSGILLRLLPPRSQQPSLEAQGCSEHTQGAEPKSEIWTGVCVLPKLCWAISKPGLASRSLSPMNWLHHPIQPILNFCSAPNKTLVSDGGDHLIVFCEGLCPPSCLQYLSAVQSTPNFLACPMDSVIQSEEGWGQRLWSQLTEFCHFLCVWAAFCPSLGPSDDNNTDFNVAVKMKQHM